MENELLIPIDSAVERFRNHLRAHDRTIFSARFGDGKTYFLTQFMKNEEVKREYVFLTLYPVNYQVAENRTYAKQYGKRNILIRLELSRLMGNFKYGWLLLSFLFRIEHPKVIPSDIQRIWMKISEK